MLNFLNRGSIFLAGGFFVSGFFCLWSYNVPNGVESYTFKYLFPPFFLLTFYFGLKKYKDRAEGEVARLFAFLIISYCAFLAASGHVLWINHLIGQQETILLEGDIMYKNSGGGARGRYRFIVIHEFDTDKEYKIGSLSRGLYNRYDIGDTYLDEWTKGSLGILYRLKYK